MTTDERAVHLPNGRTLNVGAIHQDDDGNLVVRLNGRTLENPEPDTLEALDHSLRNLLQRARSLATPSDIISDLRDAQVAITRMLERYAIDPNTDQLDSGTLRRVLEDCYDRLEPGVSDATDDLINVLTMLTAPRVHVTATIDQRPDPSPAT